MNNSQNTQNQKTRELLIGHANAYPKLTVQDIFKFLHQSAFGCEHMVSDAKTAALRILQEAQALQASAAIRIQPLDGAYSRVFLTPPDQGVSPQTLAGLFLLSAKQEPNALPLLEQKLDVADQMTRQGLFPFSHDQFSAARRQWQADGYPAIHHSDVFREAYHPSYRVIANRFLPLLPLLEALDTKLRQGRVILAIEGGSASGKTTLGSLLAALYDCTVLHMDDFFLRPEQRTPERLAEPGGNVDRERFLDQVLLPLQNNQPLQYRRFDCASGTVLPPVTIIPKPLVVVEGAYSMHPDLAPYYNLSIFLKISPDLQKKRIAKRNSPQMASRFFQEWIPLEHLYFTATNTPSRCTLTLEQLDEIASE